MKPFRFSSDFAHFNNAQTMSEYLENHCEFEVLISDGSYAEICDDNGDLFECHAAGDGDSFNHIITFVKF